MSSEQLQGPFDHGDYALSALVCDSAEGGDVIVKDEPKPQCAPLCGASKAYGRFDQPWKHERECPVRIAWEARKPSNDEILAAATNPDGSRRFYPPFEHPATARLRAHIEALKALPKSKDRDAALDHAWSEVARFEHGEDRAKRDYVAMNRRTS